MSWISIVDTAIKIGLGALIAAIASYLAMITNQRFEFQKRNEDRFYKNQDERKSVYVQFSSKSQALIKKYVFQWCDTSEEDYAEYLNIYNNVQILAEDKICTCASDTFNSVTTYITFNKSILNSGESDTLALHTNLHSKAQASVAIFQKAAQQDITHAYGNKL